MKNQSERAEEIWIAKYRAAINAKPIPQPRLRFTNIRESMHTLWQRASLQVGKLLTSRRERRSQYRRPPTRNLHGSPTLAQKSRERKPNDDKSTPVLAGKTKLAL